MADIRKFAYNVGGSTLHSRLSIPLTNQSIILNH
jgi:hypothetical protein